MFSSLDALLRLATAKGSQLTTASLSALGVRRDKAPLPSGCKSHRATVANTL